MRRMSFEMTKERIIDRSKTQTRRLGWNNLKIGDMVRPVEKSMGLKKGEQMKVLGDYDLRVTGFRKEPLSHITRADCVSEGFPDKSPIEFILGFCDAMRCTRNKIVNVIDFEYVLRGQADE